MKKKIAILYIVTGRYTIFWKDFYETFQKYFLNECEKTFFVFTDDENLPVYDNTVRIQQENLGWPYITLLRFDIFLSIEEQLKEYDHIFFINANMLAIAPVGEEILCSEHQELTVVIHPYFYDRPREQWSYDRNPQSLAYIPFDQGQYYVQGAFIGGTREGFLRMCRILSKRIQDDLKRDIIALWHDESHLNHYILDKKPLILPPLYITVEALEFTPFDAKIVYLDKAHARYGGYAYMRGLADVPPQAVQPHEGNLEQYFQRRFLKKNSLVEAMRKILIHDDAPQVISLSGDLGEQMFQYAFGRALIQQGRSVVFDNSLAVVSKYRGGGAQSPLCRLKTKIRWTRISHLNRWFFAPLPPLPDFLGVFCQKVIKNLGRYGWGRDLGFSYLEMLTLLPGRIWYMGYFRDERYFAHLRDQLQSEFCLKGELSRRDQNRLQHICSCNSVAVYMPNTKKTNSYYYDAIQYLQKHLKYAHFFIFGSKKDVLNLDPAMYTLYPAKTKYHEAVHLQLLRHCRHHIVGESALSWWGAWLAEHEQKIVIAPQKWSSEYVHEWDLPSKWTLL